jgi:hypothetical protein
MNITLDYGSLYDIVARSLSIIGKRASDNEGRNIFGNITLGSAEKKIACDFFANAFTEICATLGRFITSEIRSTSSFSDSAQIDFWSDQTPSTDDITSDGQLLYRYDQLKLYRASLSFPFVAQSPSSDTVYKYGDNYYDYTLTQIAEPTEEQMAAAITLDYFETDPQTITATSAGLLAGYDGSVYESQRQASFSEITPSATTIYYDPSGVAYRWQYGAMQVAPGGMDDSIQLVVTTPDNWNASLQLSLRQSLTNYCVSYALYSWFTITAPHISEKYLQDSQRQILTVLDMIHEKMPSQESQYNYNDINGTSI